MISDKIKRARLQDELVGLIADSIGNFLGLSDHEESAKYGFRLMTIQEREELFQACGRVMQWIKDVQYEDFRKTGCPVNEAS